MRRATLTLFLLAVTGGVGLQAQEKEKPARLPDGRSRDLAILKEDHVKSLADIAEIRKLATELEDEISTHTAHVMSLKSLRKAEQIEDLAQKLQKRMKRIP